MTTHEFAKRLLAGPEIEVVVPKVLEYEFDPDDAFCDPVLTLVEAREKGRKCKVALITYSYKP